MERPKGLSGEPRVSLEIRSLDDPGHQWSAVTVEFAFPSPRARGEPQFHTTEAAAQYTAMVRLFCPRKVHRDIAVVIEP